jgi:hypothetical protein
MSGSLLGSNHYLPGAGHERYFLVREVMRWLD